MSLWWKLRDKVRPFLRWHNYRNLVGWIPVVWDTHWWDYGYMLIIMQHQFKIMDENWRKSHYVGGDKDHKRIKEMRLLLERIIENEYYEAGPEWRKKDVSFLGNSWKATPVKWHLIYEKENWDRFCYMFHKYLQKFWD